MTETNFRALCEELLQELCCCYKPWKLKEGSYSDAMKRANAALAQPKPVAPTDEYLLAMFNNYCEARTNQKKALSNYRKAEIGRDQANALYLETQKTWLQADGMLESIEEDCREAGFDPTRYFKDKNEVFRLTPVGMEYKGQIVEDAGVVYREVTDFFSVAKEAMNYQPTREEN